VRTQYLEKKDVLIEAMRNILIRKCGECLIVLVAKRLCQNLSEPKRDGWLFRAGFGSTFRLLFLQIKKRRGLAPAVGFGYTSPQLMRGGAAW
jgi:hypothetical protein